MQIHIWSLWSIDILLLFDIDLLIISLVIYCLGSSSVSFQQPFFWTLCFFSYAVVETNWHLCANRDWVNETSRCLRCAVGNIRIMNTRDITSWVFLWLTSSGGVMFIRSPSCYHPCFVFFKHQMCDDGQSDCSHMTWVRYRSDTREHFTLH